MEGLKARKKVFILHFRRNYSASSVDDGWGWSHLGTETAKEAITVT